MSTPLVVSGPLVRYLRLGVKRELSASLAILAAALETTLDPEAYHAAARRFDEARAVFELIGVTDRPDQPDIEIKTGPLRLILRALESQHALELQRVEDAEHDGIRLPKRDLPALTRLVSDLRAQTGVYPTRRRTLAFLEHRFAKWRTRTRKRGDRH